MKIFSVLSLALITASCALAQTYSFSVKVVGHGKPVILIPGLTCTGDVWDGTVSQLKSKYQCYVLTLPGFGKQAPITAPYLSHVRDDIIAFVKDKKINHPAVIGHSLGGFMVYYLAEKEPTLWGPMVAVDGLPFLSLLFNSKATPQTMQPMADQVSRNMLAATPDQFKAGILTTLQQEITDPKNVAAMNVFCKDSDQADVSMALKEMLTTDLRSDLGKIQSHVLLIGSGQQATTDDAKKTLTDAYQSQIASIPHGQLTMAWKARHFIMLDDPDFFYKSVQDFLKQN